MKLYKIALLSLPLVLGACSDSGTESIAEAKKESALKEQAKVWTEETKKLGDTAWRFDQGSRQQCRGQEQGDVRVRQGKTADAMMRPRKRPLRCMNRPRKAPPRQWKRPRRSLRAVRGRQGKGREMIEASEGKGRRGL